MKNESEKPPFIPGLKLAQGFYKEVVQPILDVDFAGIKYSAALMGQGSEVLGFDTEMSTDHHWGPRVMLFLTPEDFLKQKDKIRAVLSQKLPHTYLGYSTNFSEPDPNDNGVQLLRPGDTGPVNHRVETFTIGGFFSDYLSIDITQKLTPADWLTLPQQKLRSIVAGKVFHDGVGLEKVQQRFAWYPPDVWLFVLAGLWARIGQEEHLTGRAGEAGDEAGSSVIASRIVRDIMRLALLMEKQYPPYPKWLGTAFNQLKSAATLRPVLERVLHGESWQERDKHLAAAYSIIAEMHNALGVTAPLPATPQLFHQRPFHIIDGGKFAAALLERITAPWLTPAMRRSPIGSIDIFTDNSDMLEDPAFRLAIRHLYETP
jgi:hypothetical protein